jgi:hypothetical protein
MSNSEEELCGNDSNYQTWANGDQHFTSQRDTNTSNGQGYQALRRKNKTDFVVRQRGSRQMYDG